MIRRISLALGVLLFIVAIACATEEITDPTKDPTELWHYGSGRNNQTVSFSYDNGCSGYTIKIVVKENPADELWSQGYPTPNNGSPVTQNITVPNPLVTPPATTEHCTVSVVITHTMGNRTTISQDVNIADP